MRIAVRLTAALILILTLAMVVLTACSSGAPAPAANSAPDTGKSGTSGQGTPGEAAAADRMVVRNGNITLIVKSVSQTRDTVVSLAERYKGYVVSSSFRTVGAELQGTITIRVADDQFLTAMAEIRTLGLRVTAEYSTSQDVTDQYIDLQARLTNAQATEQQYLTLMARATVINDIVTIQDKLSQTRQTIEQLKGQMNSLERTTSTSLIAVTLQPESDNTPIVEGGWSFTQTLRTAAHGFIEFGKVFLTVLVWVLIFSPLWAGVWALIWFTTRRKRRAAPPPPPPAAPPAPKAR